MAATQGGNLPPGYGGGQPPNAVGSPPPPRPPAVGQPAALQGQFAQNQSMYQQAYQNAMLNLGVQRQQLYNQYGIGANGQVLSDPNSLYHQMQAGESAQMYGIDAGLQNRGLMSGGKASGLGQQNVEAGNYLKGIQNAKFGQAYDTGLAHIAQLGDQATFNYNNQTSNNRMNLINWLMKNGLYTTAAVK